MDYDDFEDLIQLEEALIIEEKENQLEESLFSLKESQDSKSTQRPINENKINSRKREASPPIKIEEIKKIKTFDANVKFLYENMPSVGEFITFRNEIGKKFYLSLHDSVIDSKSFEFKFTTSDTFYEIMDQAIHYLASKESFNELVSHENYDENATLWLNKYKPKSYLDLLSNETTNRLFLRWIKAWDYYVYNRKPKKPTSTPNQSNETNQKYRKFGINENLIQEIDEHDKRPRFKMILLHGSPGLGKTTLAHLIANIAGYNAIEINASDDRSPAVLREKLEAVLNTNTSLKTSNDSYKPSCLIIDEIDGAVAASIDLLIDASRTPINSQKKSKNARLAIRRPVICICNDLYAKSMRSFRSPNVPCFILKCSEPSVSRLTDRLMEIIEAEITLPRMKKAFDKTLLHKLIDICERDVRSCINALQYMSTHKIESATDVKSLDLDAILKVSGTYKDKNTNLFGTWQQVFTIPSNPGNKDSQNLSKRVSDVVESFFSVGEPNLFIGGIFENYLFARAKDASMIVANEACRMIENFDKLQTMISCMQDYSFFKYTSIIPAWFNLSLATYNGIIRMKSFDKKDSEEPKKYQNQSINVGLKWPTAELDASNKQHKIEQIVENCLANQWTNTNRISHSDSVRMLSKREFILDTAPSLIEMISSKTKKLRPVNSQLYSKQEKETLAETVDLMLCLGLAWKLQANPDSESSELVYQLDPPIDSSVLFDLDNPDEKTSSLKEINASVQKLISHEMHLELMRRSERDQETNPNMNASFDQSRYELVVVKSEELEKKDEENDSKAKPKKDFFGRIIEKKKPLIKEVDVRGRMTPSQKWELINRDVWFKFKEGFSNAVKLPVSRQRLEL